MQQSAARDDIEQEPAAPSAARTAAPEEACAAGQCRPRRRLSTDTVIDIASRAPLAVLVVAFGARVTSADLLISRSRLFGGILVCAGVLIIVSLILQVVHELRRR